MTKSERLTRSIIGPSRVNVRPFACALDITVELLFVKGIPMDDILPTKDIYPEVARRLAMKPDTAARNVERLANRCRDALAERNLTEFVVGSPDRSVDTPFDLLIYLAFYLNFDKSFYHVIALEPMQLF